MIQLTTWSNTITINNKLMSHSLVDSSRKNKYNKWLTNTNSNIKLNKVMPKIALITIIILI